ncbi:MAG: ribonucleotide-diphosphate reductase subunit beta [Candidatus Thiodiazotropha sp.]
MLNWDDPLAKPALQEVTPAPASTETNPAHPHVMEEAARALQIEEQAEVETEAQSSMEPVNPDDKRVINGMTDINQLAPFKYPWAWEYFLNANKNHWTPLDINMAQDVHDYQHKLTLEERHVYENVLSYLTTSDILAMRNIGLAVMEKMSAPELQIYQARQVYEESLHTWTYQHCIETIGLDQGEIYNRYRVVPQINKKIQITNRRLASILRADIDLRDPDELQNFVMAYIFFAAIFEGCWFYNGFSPIFALQRRGLMKGTAEQLQYIMRDEVLHASFGIRVVNRSSRKRTSPSTRRQCRRCGTRPRPPRSATPTTFCGIRFLATPRRIMWGSSGLSPIGVRGSLGLRNPFLGLRLLCPGWMSRRT